MIWVLLITLHSYKGAGFIFTEEFKTQEQCLAFVRSYLEQSEVSLRLNRIEIETQCIRKEVIK